MTRLVGGANGSWCRLNIAAPPVGGVVKLIAAAVNEVSMTRRRAGGSGILMSRRMMNTAGGGATDYEKGQREDIVKSPEDVGAVSVEKKDISIDNSWESLQENLRRFPKWRSDKEIRTIYKRWCEYYNGNGNGNGNGVGVGVNKGNFRSFKEKVRLTDEYNSKIHGFKLDLNFLAHIQSERVVREKMSRLAATVLPKIRYSKRSRW